ncbi:unnamed protein product [Linum tenue]|uniref:Uncharacterized protein n=1 Tax=Linum tenue TaxID=586396 RepID=A0AAV0MZS6_9ROSI|nr:unnamed protein product [Linum tenue]
MILDYTFKADREKPICWMSNLTIGLKVFGRQIRNNLT